MSEEKKLHSRWNIGKALVGLVLIFIGIVYVAVYLGIFDWVIWANIWRLWPLLLIGLGAGLLVQHKFSGLGVLVIFLLLLVFAFWMLWQQSTFTSNGSVSSRDIAEPLLDGIEQGNLHVTLPSGDIRLSGPADSGLFAYGTIETRGFEHTYDVTASGKTESMTIKGRGSSQAFVGSSSLVELQLGAPLVYSVDLDIGKADVTLDFTSLSVESLNVTTGASSVTIAYGDHVEHAVTSITAGASTIALTAPDSVGVKIQMGNGISSTNFEGLEKQSDTTYASEGYESAEKTIDISISAGVSTISFSRP